jgi:lipoate-protein ligase B
MDVIMLSSRNKRNKRVMKRTMVIDLGRLGFEECWVLQHRVHRARIEQLLPDCLLLVEHPHVFTIGRRGNSENLLVPESDLRKQGIPCLITERGGDITYHGPGQLVGYPIFALKRRGIGVIDFVNRLEEVMIRVLGDYGIEGKRSKTNRGAWIGDGKAGFIGINVRRGISFHGFALNVDPELSFFRIIHPCGLKGVEATSMSAILEREIPLWEIKDRTIFYFEVVFDISMERMGLDDLLSVLPSTESSIPLSMEALK